MSDDDLIARMQARLCEYRCFVRPRVDARDEALLEESMAVITSQVETAHALQSLRKQFEADGITPSTVGLCYEVGDDMYRTDITMAEVFKVAASRLPPGEALDPWALDRVQRMADMARTNAGLHGVKLLRGHGYPDEVMRDAQDALALEAVLTALRHAVPPGEALEQLATADPTAADLADPQFEVIWQVIKRWDICTDGTYLYHGATGTDVMSILTALRRVPPGEALAQLAREAAEHILDKDDSVDVDEATAIILTALRRAVSEGSR